MIKKVRLALNRIRTADESGQAMMTVLILLLLGGLMIPPLMGLMGTGLKAEAVYEQKTSELHAADAGIEDAKWQIKHGNIDTIYSPYDFTTAWYDPDLSQPINGKNVNVTIQNVWIPMTIPIDEATTYGQSIIQSNKLIVTGTTTQTAISIPPSTTISKYKIKITYYPGASEDLKVAELGIWLPAGFEYYSDSTYKSNLEDDPMAAYYCEPDDDAQHAGNQAILWSLPSSPSFTTFPGVNPSSYPMTAEITFYFKPLSGNPGQTPDAIAWIKTSGVTDIPFSWNADIRVYKMTSTCGGTAIESYVSKSELRKMQSAIAGDYQAVGGSLMIDTPPIDTGTGIRDTLLSSSNATVSSIPTDAEVAAAFLYWSAWQGEGSKTEPFKDLCQNLGKWINRGCFNVDTGHGDKRFEAHAHSNPNPPNRYCDLKSALDLSSYTAGSVILSLDVWENCTLTSTDGLDFGLSGDGGMTWSNDIPIFRDDISSQPKKFTYTIPGQYLTSDFLIRFHVSGMIEENRLCDIDNIKITGMTADTSVLFRIDGQQVYFDADGQPQAGTQPITADRTQVLPNYNGSTPNGFSYAGSKDVTDLIRAFSDKAPDPATNYPGNGTYTVGDVAGDTNNEWSYAGWSLIIIYTNSATEGHQLYLYDTFLYADNETNIDFDNDGQPGGTISGFLVPDPVLGEINAAKLTVFVGEGDDVWNGDALKFNGIALSNTQSPATDVWNSKSPGLTADGVDIDTFSITWASTLLEPGDTYAQLDLPTLYDSWNLVYMILSFRSETSTGGALNYLIR
ncbi:MAG: hypothetical protein PHV74_09100 [Dehalococcoidia bacterium]|nr:hypothetical protein [Dehalococcoidia bacterium]